MNISYTPDIIARPFVTLKKDDVSIEKAVEECVMYIGGTPKDWILRNKSLMGLFSGKTKKLKIGDRLLIPHTIVEKALNEYASSTTLKSTFTLKTVLS